MALKSVTGQLYLNDITRQIIHDSFLNVVVGIDSFCSKFKSFIDIQSYLFFVFFVVATLCVNKDVYIKVDLKKNP